MRARLTAPCRHFWDGGWLEQLGDYMNGFKAEQTFDDDKLEDAAAWLIEEGSRAFADSDFAKVFSHLGSDLC